MTQITWDDFEKIDLVAGTIVRVEDFPGLKNPAYKVWVDLGTEIGVKKSSAQITALYTKEELSGKQVICVVNFPPKQIASFISEILITGFCITNKEVILAQPGRNVPNGAKLF